MRTTSYWSKAVGTVFLTVAVGLVSACQPTPPTATTEAPTQLVQPEATQAPTEIMPADTPEVAGPNGQLIISQATDINSLDPKFLKGRATQNVLRLMFDSLFHRDDNMQIIPWLATSVENPDPLTWRFHLQQDVKFSNGDDFRANDVKFTIERLMADDSAWSDRSFLDRVEIVDDYTVDVFTKAPYAAFMTRVVLWHMTDEEYYNQAGDDGFANQPVGTGPFTFVEWAKDEQVVLTANPNYWRGAPQIETVIFKPIPETATRIAALEAGQAPMQSQKIRRHKF